jgi:uncharacterized repeat protein (TIGR03803 family)
VENPVVRPSTSQLIVSAVQNGAHKQEGHPCEFSADGNFNGVAGGGANSAGTIFEITSGGALTTLYSFSGFADGDSPTGVVQATNRTFYGTTSRGGVNCLGELGLRRLLELNLESISRRKLDFALSFPFSARSCRIEPTVADKSGWWASGMFRSSRHSRGKALSRSFWPKRPSTRLQMAAT